MSKLNIKYSFVPPSIKLLFNNSQLEMIRTLCLIYSFYQQSKRKFIKIEEVVFYYCLVNFDMIRLIESEDDQVSIRTNLNYRYQQNVNQIILELGNLKFIELNGNLNFKSSQLKVRLTHQGHDFIQKLEINYFSELIKEYSRVINLIDSNQKNQKKLKGVRT
ncbi:hypothetical protein ACRV5I_11245 [Bacillus halotolerans]|uniref:hypothetical protein n=1 Tax=Bacillus halotolerans TaxID=260554 RepID=UPI000D035075|nr:hypothetical protein [Bacillus halotolerans]PRP55204.1 hypothetical protein C7B71_09430 [Bacillus halotolerans]